MKQPHSAQLALSYRLGIVATFVVLGIAFLLGSQGFAAPTNNSRAGLKQVEPPPTPLGRLLNDNGTLNVGSGFSGSLNPAGWQMTSELGAQRAQPRFVRTGKVGQPSSLPSGTLYSPHDPGDENWDDRFAVGMNHLVNSIAVSGTDVYAGGYFTETGGIPANRIAKWDGTTWSALGSGVNYWVYAIAVSGTDVYVGGFFTQAGGIPASLVAKWDGASWSALGDGIGNVGGGSFVNAIGVSGSDVYVGGKFTEAGGIPASNIAKWNGTSWSALGDGVGGAENDGVYAIAMRGTDVYVGGHFTQAGGIPASNIAKWNGTSWSALGAGVDDVLWGIAATGTDLYASGRFFTAGGETVHNIAKWNGTSWSALGAGVNDFAYSVAASGTNVYVGGSFTQAGGAPASHVAKWDGTSWSALGAGVSSLAYVVAANGADVYVGGDFTVAGARLSNHFGIWHEQGWISLTPTAIPTATPLPCAPGQFSDVPPGSTFHPYITCLVNRGIVSGYVDCTFRPNSNVTRAQLSKIVSNAAGYSEPAGTQMFADLLPGSTFYEFVQRLAFRNYINGYPCGGVGEPCNAVNLPYFRPNANATRGQISKIVSNAAGFNEPAGAQLFEDVAPGSTFYDFVQRLASRTIINGYPCGSVGEPCGNGNLPYFRPNANATRGQTSKIVANTFYPNCQTPSR
ncbi:MAG: S-layer homology domain-containing protein [Chloroflexota bacterium]